ncbi:MAG: protease pro-enzyme activation domain-containing protein [Actinomycetota bacterium]|nr:protease pro-enzyme activation domain-containing protein [Actinomycetota bacterium]
MGLGGRRGALARRGAAALLTTLGAAGTAGFTATPRASAAPQPMVALPEPAPSPATSGATTLGLTSASATLHVGVQFDPSNAAALSAFARAVSTPGSPTYRQYLSVAQFRARFGAPAAAIAATDSYLASHGLSLGPLAANGLYQPISGTASQMKAAFAVPLASVRTPSGQVVQGATAAPSLPANLASSVVRIAGLHPWATPTPSIAKPYPMPERPVPAIAPRPAVASGPATPPYSSVCAGMAADPSMSPNRVAGNYQLGGFYSQGNYGGAAIGLIEFSTFNPSDISTYESCLGISTPVTVVTTPSGAPSNSASQEPTADIEDAVSLAPASHVYVYQGTGWTDVFQNAIAADQAKVLSASWSSCPTPGDASMYASESTMFQEAAAQGQTFFAASGDAGTNTCTYTDSSGAKVPTTSDPASQPYVTGVGGTYQPSTGGPVVWNNNGSPGIGGGGVDTMLPAPSWQSGPGVSTYGSAPYCTSSGGCRQVPDVSALAGNGYDMFCNGGGCGVNGWSNGWSGVGGTSMASPSWAAAIALVDSTCSQPVGFLNPTLYSQAAAGTASYLTPVTQGSNSYQGRWGGVYVANPYGAYSPAAGLGSLGGSGARSLAAGQLCQATTPSQPTSGSGGGSSPAPSPGPTPTSPAQMSVSPTGLSMGQSAAAQAAVTSGTVTVTNSAASGSSTLSVTGVSVGGSDAASFSVASNGCRSPLQPGQSCAIQVGFNPPSAAGTYSGVLTVTSNSSAGSTAQVSLSGTVAAPPQPPRTTSPASFARGYYVVTARGNTYNYGRTWHGSAASSSHPPIVGMASSPTGGYWEATSAGNVLNFGTGWYGSMAGKALPAPVVAVVSTPDGKGYWLVTAKGNVYNFGDAAWMGSPAAALAQSGPAASPVVGMGATADGRGYWLVTASGKVFAFGDATWHGNAPADASRVVGMAPSPNDGGYLLATASGQVMTVGSASWHGSMAGRPLPAPVVGMVATPDGGGYWLVTAKGNVFNFGDAPWVGSAAGQNAGSPVVGLGA